jgi:ribosomal-protein-alanine N-acetyltransferase
MPPRADLIEWCSQFPPYLSTGDLQYFFEELIRDEGDIYEFEQNGQRSAVFVFLRRVRSRLGWVPLDLIAHVPMTGFENPLRQSLDRARRELPEDAQGVMVSLPFQYGSQGPMLEELGCRFSHESAHMVAPTSRYRDAPSGIVELGAEDYPSIYELTLRAFREAPDMVIPEYDLWVKRRDHHSTRSFGVRDESGTLLGFCNLILNESFVDLRTLGVEPSAQGRGIGERLLRQALFFAREAGKPNCELTVSVKNRRALALYERVGFATFSSSLAWCLPRALV